MKKRIGLAGRSGSGKDVIADFICEKYGYTKMAVADAIREEAESIIYGALTLYAQIKALPSSFDVVVDTFCRAVWNKPTSPEQRVLLQWEGTEYRRNQDESYWVTRFNERMKQHEFVVVSDIRRPDEMDAVWAVDGEVWLVKRPGVEPVGIPGHLTEAPLDESAFDRIIWNDGSIEDLKSKVAFHLLALK